MDALVFRVIEIRKFHETESTPGPEVTKLFFILNSAENESFPTHKS